MKSEVFIYNIKILYTSIVEGILFGLTPISIAVILAFVLASKIFRLESNNSLIITMFSGLGAFLGLFISSSRDSVMSSILPVIITFIAGYVAFVFKRDDEVLNRSIIPHAIVALLIASSFGAFFGAELRQTSEMNSANAQLTREKN